MATSLFRRSLLTLSAAIVAAALVFALVGSSVTERAYSEANAASIVRSAEALTAALPPSALADTAAAAAFARAAAVSGYRVTLIAADGRVIADSEADPASMENHRSRPEVAAALEGRAFSLRRKSSTLGEELVYAAAPLRAAIGAAPPAGAAGPVTGALRIALRVPSLERALAPSRWAFAIAALAFAAVATAAAAAFSRTIARPLAALARTARAYGSASATAPDSGARALRPDDPEEMRVLARTLDAMAAEIGARVATAEAQGRELEAILDAMAEAVIALDSKLAITLANPAAEALFAGAGDGAGGSLAGRGLLEATRSSALQEAAAACLDSGERGATETALYLPSERFFRVLAAPLKGAAGVVLVLGDITELRRLERVRRDFVANVSHELRTPIQLIKGFTEELRGTLGTEELREVLGSEEFREVLGAGAAPSVSGQADRFLGIIDRNAARMESLVADLLSLASLERESRDVIAAECRAVRPILESAREAVLPKAEGRLTEVALECEEGLEARADEGLLEQALVNLLDNAIKYSPPGKLVRMSARAEGGFLVVEVKDQGIGIPARDLPRIFERFYRVDKARSRELGGTGLGLAIVRHIAMAHGGDVAVESWENEGSTFRLRIPLE
jgi:two-component system, OmpR family, phosphate regulon sensor histidine kinase PhoR